MKLPSALAPAGASSLSIRRSEATFPAYGARRPLRVPCFETATPADEVIKLSLEDPTIDVYSAQLWPGTFAATSVLLRSLDERNGSVFEVGCGPGLPSLAALAHGAPAVTATDWSRWALALVEHAASTFYPGRAERLLTSQLDIFDTSAPLPRANYLVAADMLYDERLAEGVGGLVARFFIEREDDAGGAVAIVSDPNRLAGGGRAAFLRGIRSAASGTPWQHRAEALCSKAAFVHERMPSRWRSEKMGVRVLHGGGGGGVSGGEPFRWQVESPQWQLERQAGRSSRDEAVMERGRGGARRLAVCERLPQKGSSSASEGGAERAESDEAELEARRRASRQFILHNTKRLMRSKKPGPG